MASQNLVEPISVGSFLPYLVGLLIPQLIRFRSFDYVAGPPSLRMTYVDGGVAGMGAIRELPLRGVAVM